MFVPSDRFNTFNAVPFTIKGYELIKSDVIFVVILAYPDIPLNVVIVPFTYSGLVVLNFVSS